MHDNNNAMHITVLHSMPGRMRLEFEYGLRDPEVIRGIRGMKELRWNPVIRTLLCTYDPDVLEEGVLLRRIAGVYAMQLHPIHIHVRHAEEPGFIMSSSGWAALASIGIDAAAATSSAGFRTVTQWICALTTLTAVLEHGWEDLNSRGSFDPEVMSVVYLLNSLSKGTTLQASAMAWGLTFGRHLLPRDPRETEWAVYEKEDGVVLTPIALPKTGRFAGSILRKGLDAMVSKRG